ETLPPCSPQTIAASTPRQGGGVSLRTWCGRSCVRSGTARDSRLRDCSDFPRLPSRERENGGRGSTTFTAITHKLEQWRTSFFLSLPFIVLCRLLRGRGALGCAFAGCVTAIADLR